VAVSASSMGLPLLCVAATGYAVQAIHPALPGPGVPPLVFSLFVGTALSNTAFSVLARVLHERHQPPTVPATRSRPEQHSGSA